MESPNSAPDQQEAASFMATVPREYSYQVLVIGFHSLVLLLTVFRSCYSCGVLAFLHIPPL
ncbi:hypothetical protein TorRG33x02_152530, partial [Trema orientale]